MEIIIACVLSFAVTAVLGRWVILPALRRLKALVALSGQDDDVVRPGVVQGVPDGLHPVRLHHIGGGGPLQSRQDFRDDEVRVLGAGVVGGDHHEVRHLGGDAAHPGPNIRLSVDGVSFDAACGEETVPVRVGIPGGFTVYNALGVLAAAKALGVPLRDGARVLAESGGVKGRVEVVPVPWDYTVLIDYAVTPDAIENVLAPPRSHCRNSRALASQ